MLQEIFYRLSCVRTVPFILFSMTCGGYCRPLPCLRALTHGPVVIQQSLPPATREQITSLRTDSKCFSTTSVRYFPCTAKPICFSFVLNLTIWFDCFFYRYFSDSFGTFLSLLRLFITTANTQHILIYCIQTALNWVHLTCLRQITSVTCKLTYDI